MTGAAQTSIVYSGRLPDHQGRKTLGESRHQPVRDLAADESAANPGLGRLRDLYADSRRWLANGWLDYFSPQLYWPVDVTQSFPCC